jgi:hypothetical protein
VLILNLASKDGRLKKLPRTKIIIIIIQTSSTFRTIFSITKITDHVVGDLPARVGAEVELELDGLVLLVSRLGTTSLALGQNDKTVRNGWLSESFKV